MKVKMKRCMDCKTLLSNSSKACTKCGSKDLEKGFYTDETNRNLNESKNDIRLCPICCAPISKNAKECAFCGAGFFRNSQGEISATDYDDYIDKQLSRHSEGNDK